MRPLRVHLRHLRTYFLFVGGPLVGLLGVLRLGERIDAPMAIHGSYAVRVPVLAAAPCYTYLFAAADSAFTVAQSGRRVTMTLGPAAEVMLSGVLSGADLVVDGVLTPGALPDSLGCIAGDTIRLTARARREHLVKRLDGTVWASRCAGCAPLAFGAVRPRGYAGRRRS